MQASLEKFETSAGNTYYLRPMKSGWFQRMRTWIARIADEKTGDPTNQRGQFSFIMLPVLCNVDEEPIYWPDTEHPEFYENVRKSISKLEDDIPQCDVAELFNKIREDNRLFYLPKCTTDLEQQELFTEILGDFYVSREEFEEFKAQVSQASNAPANPSTNPEQIETSGDKPVGES